MRKAIKASINAVKFVVVVGVWIFGIPDHLSNFVCMGVVGQLFEEIEKGTTSDNE